MSRDYSGAPKRRGGRHRCHPSAAGTIFKQHRVRGPSFVTSCDE